MRKFLTYFLSALFLTVWTATATAAYAQASNASLGGVVQDATKALIPGVTVTLTNTETGVVDTRLTNDSGAYQFPSVPPGTYKLTGDLMGFRPSTQSNLQLGTAAQVRIDLTLQIGTGAGDVVQVTVSADSRINETSSSVGEVLTKDRIDNLPIVGNNILDLLVVLPGYRDSFAGPGLTTIGGLGLDSVNTTVNGISTNSTRNQASQVGAQIFTNTVINPDLVGEVRLILAPVDAELGRGNAQIQIQTRSGTNKYTGSAVWNNQNTALNSNTWLNNHTPTTVNGLVVSNKTTPDWRNINQITASYGGPIIKSKTFFFVLYDKQQVNARTMQSNQVLTDSARQGIFRYFPGWNPGNAAFANPSTFGNVTTGTYQSVDTLGNPLPISQLRDPSTGGPYTGTLTCFSVFGNVLADGVSPITQAIKDQYCPGGNFILTNPGTTWDAKRTGPDPTGYMQRVLALAPHANNFSIAANAGVPAIGDGLNTAANRYVRGSKGSGTINAVVGVVASAGDYNNRNQLNARIDHTFNRNHRLSFSWNYERDDSVGGQAAYEGGLQGNTHRRPSSYAFNGTSTLTSNLINESRFGVSINKTQQTPPWNNAESSETAEAARSYLLQGGLDALSGRNHPVIFNPGTNVNGFMAFGGSDLASSSPNWNVADTMRWSQGKHSFSFGGEYRRPMTSGYTAGSYSTAALGNFSINGVGLAATTPLMSTTTNFSGGTGDTAGATVGILPGFLQTARTNAVNLNYLFYGSLSTVTTPYWIDNQADRTAGTWRNATTPSTAFTDVDPYGHQTRSQISNEWSFFFKDDYKVLKRLTLNLGLRFDLNMSPYLTNGLTSNFVGDGLGLYGAGRPVSGDVLSQWLTPGNMYLAGYGSNGVGNNGLGAAAPLQCQLGVTQTPIAPTDGGPVLSLPSANCDPNLMSTVQFIGPGSVNPDETLVPQKGRWSPAVGFAWQIPWFGEGKTTMRGGFQRTYGGAGAQFQSGAGAGPGGDSISAGTGSFSAATEPLASIIATRAPNLQDIATLIPVPPTRLPGQKIPIANRSVAVTQAMYDPSYITPYTDNFTLSVTRNVARNVTVDVRFVDTLGRRQAGTQNLNLNNVWHNPELLHALDVTRAGGNAPLFDSMLLGLNLNPGTNGYSAAVGSNATFTPTSGATSQILQRGSAALRRNSTFTANIANGNYDAVIDSLVSLTTAGVTATPIGLEPIPTNLDPVTGLAPAPSQRLLRNGCNRIANGKTKGFVNPDDGTTILPSCFPENYVYANPQLTTANYTSNNGRSNYQSAQFQFTARPIQGISVQGTFTISKTMQLPSSGYTDPLDRELDYREPFSSIGREFRSNGSFELPLGPNKLLFGNSSGWVARAIERWQTSIIFTLPQGGLRPIIGNTMLYANGRPDVVGPWDNPRGEVHWEGGPSTNFFGGTTSKYTTYRDPQCASGAVNQTLDPLTNFNFAANCTLNGMGLIVPAGTTGSVAANAAGLSVIPMLQNPLPGHQGNLGYNTMRTIARRRLDANISKMFRISESKSLQIRIDATNIMNHPQEADPVGLDQSTNVLTSTTFGQINSKTGSRTFQTQLRFSF